MCLSVVLHSRGGTYTYSHAATVASELHATLPSAGTIAGTGLAIDRGWTIRPFRCSKGLFGD